jgi:hypothetical protein
MRYQQTQEIRQQPQQHGGGLSSILGTLFNLVSTVFPNPVTPVASALLHPTAGNISGAVGGITNSMNDKNPAQNNNTMTEELLNIAKNIGAPQQKENDLQKVGPSPENKAKENQPGQVQTKDVSFNNQQQPQQTAAVDPFGAYQDMSLKDIYAVHPELATMFPMMLQQLPSYINSNRLA